jgi:hypothetical protein
MSLKDINAFTINKPDDSYHKSAISESLSYTLIWKQYERVYMAAN